MKRLYYHKWFPRLFYKKYDGGEKSGVIGYMLIEWKPVFSIGILKFNKGSREAFHTHAFNAITWWLKGSVTEEYKDNNISKDWNPSLKPKYTSRSCYHKVVAHKTTWALTLRGPWIDVWKEFRIKEGREVKLTHNRVETI